MGLFTDYDSCSAAYCLVFDATPARRMSTDLSQTGREMHLCKSAGSVGDNKAPYALEKANERIRPQIAQSTTDAMRTALSKNTDITDAHGSFACGMLDARKTSVQI